MIIKRNNYIEEEQKEFGYITSKVVRPLRVKIGKARKKAAEKLVDSAEKSLERNNKVIDMIDKWAYEGPTNSKLNKNVQKELDTAIKEGYVSKAKETSGDSYFNRKTKEIAYEDDTPATVLHELGHAKIDSGKMGKINQLIQSRPAKFRYSSDLGKKEEIINSTINKVNSQKHKGSLLSSLKDTVKSAINGVAQVHVEKTASKSALKDLKRIGKETLNQEKESLIGNTGRMTNTDKEILKDTKNNIDRIISHGKRINDLALDTYVSSAKRDIKLNAANLVNIPSRRVK